MRSLAVFLAMTFTGSLGCGGNSAPGGTDAGIRPTGDAYVATCHELFYLWHDLILTVGHNCGTASDCIVAGGRHTGEYTYCGCDKPAISWNCGVGLNGAEYDRSEAAVVESLYVEYGCDVVGRCFCWQQAAECTPEGTCLAVDTNPCYIIYDASVPDSAVPDGGELDGGGADAQ
jgi:hypothetical protein